MSPLIHPDAPLTEYPASAMAPNHFTVPPSLRAGLALVADRLADRVTGTRSKCSRRCARSTQRRRADTRATDARSRWWRCAATLQTVVLYLDPTLRRRKHCFSVVLCVVLCVVNPPLPFWISDLVEVGHRSSASSDLTCGSASSTARASALMLPWKLCTSATR